MDFESLFEADFDSSLDVRKGDLLIAEPFLADANFGRSVILVCEHDDEQGTFGLTLNKPTEISVEGVAEAFPFDVPLFVGGPVERNTLHFVHRLPELEGAQPLKNGLYWSGDPDRLRDLHLVGKVKPHTCRFFVGYSGWGPRQLRGELERKAWTVARLDLSELLATEHHALWSRSLREKGGKFRMFANYPEDPRLN